MAFVDQVVVMLKAPRPGWVKTRLAQRIGVLAATEAYRSLAMQVLANLPDLPAVELRHAPDDAAAEVAPWLRSGWTLAPQGDGDLGSRLVRAFAEHFAAGARRVVVLGADCPYVTEEDIREAFNALKKADLVLGPAVDGGYWSVGLRTPCPELFSGVAWSTALVLAQTEQRAAALGISVARLRTLSDVDTEDDWQQWRESRTCP